MDLTKREKIGLSIFGAILILGAAAMNFRGTEGISVIPKSSALGQTEQQSSTAVTAPGVQNETDSMTGDSQNNKSTVPKPTTTMQSARLIKVCVLGAVKNPGVYTISEGDRIEQAVQLAGGFTKSAQTSQINLARKVNDEDLIRIPDITEKTVSDIQSPVVAGVTVAVDAVQQSSSKININTASLTQLDTLPRIGMVMAQRIIDYRQQSGRFKTIESLMDVSGIGPKVFESLKDKISVE